MKIQTKNVNINKLIKILKVFLNKYLKYIIYYKIDQNTCSIKKFYIQPTNKI